MNTKTYCPTVAVALAVYNGEAWLRQQLDSILNQHEVSPTIFISVDLSSDDSKCICVEYSEKYSNIHLLPDVGRLGNAAKNFFRLLKDIDLSGFDYLSLADQDDIWREEKLSNGIGCLNIYECDGYSSNLNAFDLKKGQSWLIEKDSESSALDYLFQGASAGCTYVLTQKAALLIQKAIDSNFLNAMVRPSHDWTFYAICRSNGLKWYYDKNTFIDYRQHESNFYGARRGLSGMIQKMKTIKSGWYKSQILFLEHMVVNSEAEKAVFTAVKRNSLSDRVWLFRNSYNFRRERKEQVLLSFIFLFGLLK